MKGNKAQESIGPQDDGNIVVWRRTLQWSKALWSGEHQLETAGAHNGEKATTVVTQDGCCKGKRFEGYDIRAWESHRGPNVAEMRQEGGCGGNGPNPMAGCRAKQTYEAICGVNRRSREERQGRKMCLAWRPNTEDQTSSQRCGLDRTRMAHISGGAFFGKPHERKFD